MNLRSIVGSIFLIFLINGETIEFDNIQFEYLSQQHGLSQKAVQFILQDSNEFLWFATQEGLNRYDGKSFKVFRHNPVEKNSLAHDFVQSLAEDMKGNLWIATANGLSKLDSETEMFETVKVYNKEGQSVTRLNTVYIDNANRIWIGTDGGGLFFASLNDSKMVFTQVNNTYIKSDSKIKVIFEDSRERFWFGTDGDGIVLINKNNVDNKIFQNDGDGDRDSNVIGHNRIRSIIEDSRGQIWVGTRGGGVSRYNEISEKFFTYYHNPSKIDSLSHDWVYQLYEDDAGNIWIATDAGINIFDRKLNQFTRIQKDDSLRQSLSSNRVLSIFQDHGRNIWVGTIDGLNKWNPIKANFEHYQKSQLSPYSLSHNFVTSFAEDDKGGVYIATYGGGLNYLDDKGKNISRVELLAPNEEFKVPQHLMSLFYDSKKRLWIGTRADGAFLLDNRKNSLKNFRNIKDQNDSLSANGVTNIFEDRSGTIWLSTYQRGINKFNEKEQSFYRYQFKENDENSISSNHVYQVLQDEDGYFWIVTDGGGISRLDSKSGKVKRFRYDENDDESLSGDVVYWIFQDSKSRFWIGTQANGLNMWEPSYRRNGIGKFHRYSLYSGLISSTVFGILEDDLGAIWLSSNRGVSKLDPETGIFKHYYLAEEMHFNEFAQGAFLRTKNGRLLFGGVNGISTFFPRDIVDNPHVPPIALTNILVLNKEVTFDSPTHKLDRVEFGPQDYLVSFEFAALDFSQPEKNQYKYKLEGLDPDWINTGTLNRATFTNLPSGSYKLKVKASNNDGVWNEEGIEIDVYVAPSIWVTWWALSLYAVLFCLFILLFIRTQAKKIAEKDLFQSMVSDQVASEIRSVSLVNHELKAQIQTLKQQASRDTETGLPNQSLLGDLLGACTDMLNRLTIPSSHQQNESSIKMSLILVRLSQFDYLSSVTDKEHANHILRSFVHKLQQQSYHYQVICRWSDDTLAIIRFFDGGETVDEYLSQLVDIASQTRLSMSSTEEQSLELNIGFALYPLNTSTTYVLKWEHLLNITENAMRSVTSEKGSHWLGITGLKKPLTASDIKQIMSSDNLMSQSEFFEFESDLLSEPKPSE